MSVHFSSKSYEWETPQELFDKYDNIYNFDLDVCATAANAKCKRFFTKEDDGLRQEWFGACWMNPPYGREISKWISKAYYSSLQSSCFDLNATVVCLVPSRTDTAWWHDYAMRGKIEFLRGRIKFSNCANAAPFPSAIIIFEGKS